MRLRPSFISTSLLLALTVALGAQQDRQMGGLGLEVFADNNFRGLSATYLYDTPDLDASGMAGRISSLRVAPGEVWEVCTERSYRGRCQVVSGSESDLRRNGWNDVIVSVRRVRGGGGPGGGRGGAGSLGIELFAGTRYSGQRVVMEQAVSNLRSVNFNDRASSLRVPRGEVWEVCVNADFDDCRIVDGDVPDLGPVGLSREISSVRQRFDGRRGGRAGRGDGTILPQPRIVLYNQSGYRGRATTVEREFGSLGWEISDGGSIRVAAGRWDICDGAGFTGRCVVVTADVPDIRRLGLRDRIWSVRPR